MGEWNEKAQELLDAAVPVNCVQVSRTPSCGAIATALREAHAQGRREGLEEAAAVCEDRGLRAEYVAHGPRCILLVARRIRALTTDSTEQGGGE